MRSAVPAMKAVLFDLGRVLVHYDHARTRVGLASVCPPGADVAGLLQPVIEALGLGHMDGAGLYAHFCRTAQVTVSFEAFCSAFCAGIGRDEQALAWALALNARDGVQVGVISNTNALHVEWLDAHVPELRSLPLVLMSNEAGLQKPDPAIYRLALELLDVGAEDALFVDDLAENVQAAQALGMAGIVHSAWPATRGQIESWLLGG